MSCSSSDLFAAGAEFGQNAVDAVLVDGAQRVRGNPQLDPAVFAGDPETALVQVRQEAAAGLVVGVRDVVAGLHALAGNLAYAGHYAPRFGLVFPLARETAAPADRRCKVGRHAIQAVGRCTEAVSYTHLRAH